MKKKNLESRRHKALRRCTAVLGRREIGLWPETGLVMDDLR